MRGIDGLRVLDVSAMPGIIRGHTMAPALYIAERGASVTASENERGNSIPARNGFVVAPTNESPKASGSLQVQAPTVFRSLET